DHAPFAPFLDERLPGMAPLDEAEWLHRDAAFAPQMAYRDRLVALRPDVVIAGEGRAGSVELLAFVLDALEAHDPAYAMEPEVATRPDGMPVPLDPAQPFATLARLVQEDLLLLEKPERAEEHRLIGAALLFHARWSLAEKMGRPLVEIHDRVPAYDGGLAPRVQRLFDALRPGRPLVRANWLVHGTNELHQPKLFETSAKTQELTGRFWLRVERQCILRLPESGAVVFSVKTCVTPIEALDEAQRVGLIEALEEQGEAMRDYHGGAAHSAAAATALRDLGGQGGPARRP
ncbi:MAG: DUF3445 domain-containing protein, partial [Pseudomonadota bacterium]